MCQRNRGATLLCYTVALAIAMVSTADVTGTVLGGTSSRIGIDIDPYGVTTVSSTADVGGSSSRIGINIDPGGLIVLDY